MTVKELSELLQKHKPEMPVYMVAWNDDSGRNDFELKAENIAEGQLQEGLLGPEVGPCLAIYYESPNALNPN